jgi:hypothetical protein
MRFIAGFLPQSTLDRLLRYEDTEKADEPALNIV